MRLAQGLAQLVEDVDQVAALAEVLEGIVLARRVELADQVDALGGVLRDYLAMLAEEKK